jgi:zinc protease
MTRLLTALALATSSAAAQPMRYPVIPTQYEHLANGLKVVLAPDSSASLVMVGVYYAIGQRTEPVGREGFAHLFEHLMFEGSTNLPPGALIRLIESNGGTFNGNTRFDFTDYFEITPPAALERMLWAEADRMRGLVVDDAALGRQKAIVKSEIRLSYVNQPDGGFPWLDVPQVANRNWQNAHDFRGRPDEIDSATLADARAFHAAYYVPNNAVLVVSGAFRVSEAQAWIDKYFADIPRGEAVRRPDVTEPPQTKERRGVRIDSLAKQPVLAVAFHMPPRHTRAFWAMVLIDQMLVQGHDAWLGDDAVFGGTNLQGNFYNYEGPMLWTIAAQYRSLDQTDTIVRSIQDALARLRKRPVGSTALRVARQKAHSAYYDILDYLGGFGRLDLLASFALFDDDPTEINRIETSLDEVTPADIRTAARDYLSPRQATIYVRRPA